MDSLLNQASGLWAVTPYFNPARYHSRLANYRIFRRRLNAPLLAVELSFGGRFELGPGDADILVQIRGGDVMWQKERLLNIALERLPAGCDAVAWVDADVVFEKENWAGQTREALDRHRLVQPFSERCDLDTTVEEEEISSAERHSCGSVAWAVTNEGMGVEILTASRPLAGRTKLNLGLAWACRLDTLRRHSFFDAGITGGGDRAILGAAMGAFEHTRDAMRMNEPRYRHYLAWARPFFDSVGGSIGHVDGRAYHLWHGDVRRRRYNRRYDLLSEFDPFTDIAIGESGAWRWNSAKPALHSSVKDYFALRREDG